MNGCICTYLRVCILYIFTDCTATPLLGGAGSNGVFSITGTSAGSIVFWECDPGYLLSGSRVGSCNGTDWVYQSPVQPNCDTSRQL